MNRPHRVQRLHWGSQARYARGMVVLAMALAVMLVGALALLMQAVQRQRDETERMRVTIERMERIRTALCAHARLSPSGNDLPAPPPLSPSPARSAVPLVLGWYGGAGTAALGQLGLSVEDVTDGWGRLFTVFLKGNCNSSPFAVDGNGDGDAVDAGEANAACVVLISHGPSGRGAFLPQETPGGQLPWMGPLPSGAGSPTNGAGGEWRNTRANNAGGPQDPPLAAAAPNAACTGDRQDLNDPCHFDDVVRYYDGVDKNLHPASQKPLCL